MSAAAAQPGDAMAVATHIMTSGAPRRAATGVSVDDILAMADRLQALDAIALMAADHLAALSRDRAAHFFAAADVLAAHNDLANALAAYGYVTLKAPLNQEQTDGHAE